MNLMLLCREYLRAQQPLRKHGTIEATPDSTPSSVLAASTASNISNRDCQIMYTLRHQTFWSLL